MRKQDRIANQKSGSPDADKLKPSESQDRERTRSGGEPERMKGGGSEGQRPQRQPGKLPLPD